MSADVSKRIELAIERIRPAMQMDGGDVKLVAWNEADRTVQVSVSGACSGCQNIASTVSLGVERVIKQLVPEVAFVVVV